MHVILIAVNISAPQIGFLFDMDGVLINSMALHTRSWEIYLDKLGLKVDDLEARMHGKRNPELVRELISSNLPEDAVFEHGAAKERLFRELMAAEMESYRIAGVTEFLDRHPDIPKAIGSNAERANIDFTLERFGFRPYFAVVVDGTEVERPKPFPDIYLLAARKLNLQPEQCIVFEDSPVGAAAGKAAGMRTIGVETIPTTFDDVDLIISNFQDPRLESWLADQTSSLR